ncbi:MAG: hypothetical protein VB104_07900 [Candidatus Limiplasma sp.]|nr:hypothetical protein [Candidatus Limiplasma sp.]
MNQRTDKRPALPRAQPATSRLTTVSETFEARGAGGESARACASASVGTDGSFSFSLVTLEAQVPQACRAEMTEKAMAALRRGLARAQAAGLPLEGGEKT